METEPRNHGNGPPAGQVFLKQFILALLGFYKQAISPALPSSCKFFPTCSEYATEAVVKYGPGQGLWMAARRLLRCRPFHAGGYDPVQ